MKRTLIRIGPLLALMSVFSSLSAESVSEKKASPNFVLIVADDLGYSDFGCYGGEIGTPNVDRLAANGLRYRSFYNSARCCPTRASLLTGMYPHAVNLHVNGNDLSDRVPTIAEILRENGYSTAMAGKWHLSRARPRTDEGFFSQDHLAWLNNQEREDKFAPLNTYPSQRGFDRFHGIIWGVVSYYDPFSLVDGMEPVTEVPEDYHFTEAVTERSLDYIKSMSTEEKPFFLYVAHAAPHWPLHAPEERIKSYRGMYDDGWQALRDRRFTRQKELGLFSEDCTLPPLDTGELGSWENLDEESRATYRAKMETHAAMVEMLDEGVGRIVDTLREMGQLDNTLIMILSDNGASPEEVHRPGYDRPSETRDGRPIKYAGELKAEDVGREIAWAGIGPAWANAANTPFRWWKKESFEGGCNTPCVVHWPAGLGTDRSGEFVEGSAHVMDVLPTILEIAGIRYPNRFSEYDLKGSDGRSLVADWQSEDADQPERMLFFQHEQGAAVRWGKWKIARLSETEGWSLFDMESDPTESTDLARERGDILEKLDTAWNEWYAHVIPDYADLSGAGTPR